MRNRLLAKTDQRRAEVVRDCATSALGSPVVLDTARASDRVLAFKRIDRLRD